MNRECSRCGIVYSPDSYPQLGDEYHDYCISCKAILMTVDNMKRLMGRKVIKVDYYSDTDTFILSFDGEPKLYLTAEDGEYGDNAFKFLD